jgi:hypothetical protein
VLLLAVLLPSSLGGAVERYSVKAPAPTGASSSGGMPKTITDAVHCHVQCGLSSAHAACPSAAAALSAAHALIMSRFDMVDISVT